MTFLFYLQMNVSIFLLFINKFNPYLFKKIKLFQFQYIYCYLYHYFIEIL